MRMVRFSSSSSTSASSTRRQATGWPQPGQSSCSEVCKRLGLKSATRWAARSGAVVMSTIVMPLLSLRSLGLRSLGLRSLGGPDGFAQGSAYALTNLVCVQQIALAHPGLVLGHPTDRLDHRAVV